MHDVIIDVTDQLLALSLMTTLKQHTCQHIMQQKHATLDAPYGYLSYRATLQFR